MRYLLALFCFFLTVPALAQYQDEESIAARSRIKAIVIDGQYQTASVSLFEPLPEGTTVVYEIYLQGNEDSPLDTGAVGAAGDVEAVVEGVREIFEGSGEDIYKLTFAVCEVPDPGHERINVNYCGFSFSKVVSFTLKARGLHLTSDMGEEKIIIEVGDRFTLTGTVKEPTNDQLTLAGVLKHQLDCRNQNLSRIESEWLCTARSSGDTNSELFFYIDSDEVRSNSIEVQVVDSLAFNSYIEDVRFSPDFDAAIVTLNNTPPEKVSVKYELYKEDETIPRLQDAFMQREEIETTYGFSSLFEQLGGEGRYRLEFYVCPRESHDLGIVKRQCSEMYEKKFFYSSHLQSGLFLRSEDRETVIDVNVGETFNLKGSVEDPTDGLPELANSASRQVECNRTTSTTADAEWNCKGLSQTGEGAELYFYVGSQENRSNTVIVQVGNTESVSSGKPDVPLAQFEDPVLPGFSEYRNPFPDTSTDLLSGKAAAELYRRSVIAGFPGGEFKGGEPVNRAQAAKILLLARFEQIADIANNGQFSDVVSGEWYVSFVVTAALKGIINGHPDGTFRPGETVNTAEFLKMMIRAFDLEIGLPYTYKDVPEDAWFAPFAGVAEKYDLFPERDSSFLEPGKTLTRTEVVVAIYQYFSKR